MNNLKFYYLGITPNSFKLREVTPAFVKHQLKNLKIKKSTGVDNIGPRFLNDGADALTGIITHLINLSIKNKIVPKCTKGAKVTPLFKKNNKLEIGNYRPVSVLTSISKILEKAIHSQVENYCKSKNVIYPLQSGFRDKYSTTTCLIHLHDYIRREIEKGNYVGMVMLDVQKAFDSVDHNMLCEKIRLLGIEPEWFKSYLSNRKQRVLVNGVYSSDQIIKCGVPQGSILGPWCYLVYCNDMTTCTKSKMIMYADDTILLVSQKNLNHVSEHLSTEMKNCFHWLVNNRLSMHKGKTEALILSSKRKRHLTKNFHIKLDEHTIKPSEAVKYLGLTINSTLSGEEIVASIVSKSVARLKFLYRQSKALDRKTRTLLCKALIMCHFDYAIAAWHQALSKGLKTKLQVAQNKVVRFALDLGPRTHIGQNELDRVGILSVNDRARQLMLNQMYDISRGTAPSYLKDEFKFQVNYYNTRSEDKNFKVPFAKGISQYNFSVTGAREWNDLPPNVKKLQSKDTFKKAVKIYLKTQAHAKELSEYV